MLAAAALSRLKTSSRFEKASLPSLDGRGSACMVADRKTVRKRGGTCIALRKTHKIVKFDGQWETRFERRKKRTGKISI